MNDRQEALNFVSGFLAGFYHQTWDYEAATKNARTHIEQYPHVKEEMTSAFENVLANSFPPNTFLKLVRDASRANHYVDDDANARTFLQELYNDVILKEQNSSEALNGSNGSLINSLDNEDEEDDPFETFTLDGELDIPRLIADLQNGDAESRSQAVVALAKSGKHEAVEPLIATLKNHSNPRVRWGAIQVLWRLGDMRALEPLIAALQDDEDSYVRRAAAYALGQLRDQRAIQPLIATFYDETRGVAHAASLALAQFGACVTHPLLAFLRIAPDEHSSDVEAVFLLMNDDNAIDPLLAYLADEDSRMRAYAALFLMNFDDQRIIQPLTQALKDEDESVRHYARLSLGVLGENLVADVAY